MVSNRLFFTLFLVGMARTTSANTLFDSGEMILNPGYMDRKTEYAYCVSTDGGWVAVGAYEGAFHQDKKRGSVHIFNVRNGNTETQEIQASDASQNAYFGEAVALKGDLLAVGSPGRGNTGALYIYERQGDSWTEFAGPLVPHDLSDNSNFGEAVATDGTWVVVGGSGADEKRGTAVVYEKTSQGWVVALTLIPTWRVKNAYFGDTVAIANGIIAVGANGESNGCIYIYEKAENDEWHLASRISSFENKQQAGEEISIYGDTIVVGVRAEQFSLGKIYVIKKSQHNGWDIVQTLSIPISHKNKRIVAKISKNRIFARVSYVGDQYASGEESEHGYVYLFERPDAASDFGSSPTNLDVSLRDYKDKRIELAVSDTDFVLGIHENDKQGEVYRWALATSSPTKTPTNHPTKFPTQRPTTASPTQDPTKHPTVSPTKDPTKLPTREPTSAPTINPTVSPTLEPTKAPSRSPTVNPTVTPTRSPTLEPTAYPTKNPSTSPTRHPTTSPTVNPTKQPTRFPTRLPTIFPSVSPTKNPTAHPTNDPTRDPTSRPSKGPTVAPSKSPTRSPTPPTNAPTNPAEGTKFPTAAPTTNPTVSPTSFPTVEPTMGPTKYPTVSPTKNPTVGPTASPTANPTTNPTDAPSKGPTRSPSTNPTAFPSSSPTTSPTRAPTGEPTKSPTRSPTVEPSVSPTKAPTGGPTLSPTLSPSASPSNAPSVGPTASPTVDPTANPTKMPSSSPSVAPTHSPTVTPSISPTTLFPSRHPTTKPTNRPTQYPTFFPTIAPSGKPSVVPTEAPVKPNTPTTLKPTAAPTKLVPEPLVTLDVPFTMNETDFNTESVSEVKSAMLDLLSDEYKSEVDIKLEIESETTGALDLTTEPMTEKETALVAEVLKDQNCKQTVRCDVEISLTPGRILLATPQILEFKVTKAFDPEAQDSKEQKLESINASTFQNALLLKADETGLSFSATVDETVVDEPVQTLVIKAIPTSSSLKASGGNLSSSVQSAFTNADSVSTALGSSGNLLVNAKTIKVDLCQGRVCNYRGTCFKISETEAVCICQTPYRGTQCHEGEEGYVVHNDTLKPTKQPTSAPAGVNIPTFAAFGGAIGLACMVGIFLAIKKRRANKDKISPSSTTQASSHAL